MTSRSRAVGRVAAAWLALAFVALVSSPVEAQQIRGFADERLDPSERGSDWFALESLDLRGSGRPAVGVVGDFAYRPVVFQNPDGSVGASVVRNQYILHPGASLVAWNRVRFGLDVPIAVLQDGHVASQGGVTYEPASGVS